VTRSKQNKRVVSDLTMPNGHVRKIIENFQAMTATCFDATIEEEQKGRNHGIALLLFGGLSQKWQGRRRTLMRPRSTRFRIIATISQRHGCVIFQVIPE
jgi:hypothetical protein